MFWTTCCSKVRKIRETIFDKEGWWTRNKVEEKSFCKDLGNLNSSSQDHLLCQEMVTLMEGLREAEENILECLGSGHRLLYNLAATKKLASIKKQHEEIVERLVVVIT